MDGGDSPHREMRMPDARDDLYMPFQPLLFFGEEGNGDPYAFRILAATADPTTVYLGPRDGLAGQQPPSGLRGTSAASGGTSTRAEAEPLPRDEEAVLLRRLSLAACGPASTRG